MDIIRNPTPEQWNTVAHHCDHPNINQSWEWGEVYRKKKGIRVLRLLALHHGQPVGALQAFEWKRFGISLAVITGGSGGGGGPIIVRSLSHKTQQECVHMLIQTVFAEARSRGALKTTLYTPVGETFSLSRNINAQITPQCTPVALLPTDPHKMLYEKIDPKTRNQIVKGEKNGIHVCEGTRDDLAIYRTIQQLLVRQKHLPRSHLNSLATLHHLWDALVPNNMMKIWIATKSDEVLGGAIVLYYTNGLLYQSGVVTDKGRKFYASNVIQWHIIRDAIERGYTFYNLGGGTKDPTDPRYGITKFKMGFGSEFMDFQRYSAHGNRWLRALVYKTMRMVGRNEWFPLLVYP